MGKRHANKLLRLAREVFPLEVLDYSQVIEHLDTIGDLSPRQISDWMIANGVAIGQNDIFQVLNHVQKVEANREIESAKILGDRVLEHREKNFGGFSAEELMKGKKYGC